MSGNLSALCRLRRDRLGTNHTPWPVPAYPREVVAESCVCFRLPALVTMLATATPQLGTGVVAFESRYGSHSAAQSLQCSRPLGSDSGSRSSRPVVPSAEHVSEGP